MYEYVYVYADGTMSRGQRRHGAITVKHVDSASWLASSSEMAVDTNWKSGPKITNRSAGPYVSWCGAADAAGFSRAYE